MEISSCRYHDRENYEVGNSEGYCGTNGDYPPILGKGMSLSVEFWQKRLLFLIPGILCAENTANGNGMSPYRFLSSRLVSPEPFLSSFYLNGTR